jgi:hypothetical protein
MFVLPFPPLKPPDAPGMGGLGDDAPGYRPAVGDEKAGRRPGVRRCLLWHEQAQERPTGDYLERRRSSVNRRRAAQCDKLRQPPGRDVGEKDKPVHLPERFFHSPTKPMMRNAMKTIMTPATTHTGTSPGVAIKVDSICHAILWTFINRSRKGPKEPAATTGSFAAWLFFPKRQPIGIFCYF